MTFSMKVEGGDRLARTLRELPLRVSKAVLRDALRDVAAPPIQQAAKSTVARSPGAPDLADHIVIGGTKTDAGPVAGIVIGPSMAQRRDKARKYPMTFATQGTLLEFGTARQKMQAFLRPAFDQEAARTIPALAAALWRALIRRGAAGTRGSSTGGGLA